MHFRSLSDFFSLRWPGVSQRESGRFARIDSRESIRRKKPIFITCERFARIASNLWFASFSPSKCDLQKKGVQFGNPKTIRENRAIRANLRIDSRKSGHLSLGSFFAFFVPFSVLITRERSQKVKVINFGNLGVKQVWGIFGGKFLSIFLEAPKGHTSKGNRWKSKILVKF